MALASSASATVRPRRCVTSCQRPIILTPFGGTPPVSLNRATTALRFSGEQVQWVTKSMGGLLLSCAEWFREWAGEHDQAGTQGPGRGVESTPAPVSDRED